MCVYLSSPLFRDCISVGIVSAKDTTLLTFRFLSQIFSLDLEAESDNQSAAMPDPPCNELLLMD